MAFVFRSPRNLDALSPSHSQQIQNAPQAEPQSQLQCQDKKSPGKLIKGFRCKLKEGQINIEKQFYFANNQEIIGEMKKKNQSNKQQNQENTKHQQQYFFKSKTKRQFQKVKCSLQRVKRQDEIEQEQQIIHKQSPKKSFQSKGSKKGFSKNRQERSEPKNMLQAYRRDIQYLKNTDQEQIGNNTYAKGKEPKNLQKTFNLLNCRKQTSTVFGVPSIPGKQQKYGYVIKQNKLFYPQMVPKPRFQGKANNSPGPTDYNISQNKKVKGVVKFNSCSNSKHERPRNDQCLKYAALLNDQQALKMHNQKIKEWVYNGREQKKRKKKEICQQKFERSQLETRDMSNQSEQQGQTEYQFDTTPGPGYYSDNFSSVNNKKCFRSKNQKFSKIYISQCERFPNKIQDKYRTQNSQIFDSNKWQQKMPNSKFYISKLKRDFGLQKRQTSPPPGHYNIRISLENDVITDILRNSPKLFNNNLPRLAQTVNSQTPGPGHYSHKMPNFKVQSFVSPRNIMQRQQNKQKEEIKLKLYQQILVQTCPRVLQAESIHNKRKKSSQAIKRAPFLSSSPKKMDLNPQLDYRTELPRLPPQVPSNTNKENIYPFNSSQAKGADNNLSYGAQVGLYSIDDIHGWQKKSFNVLFN